MNPNADFGELLRSHRENNNLTQTQAAAALGVSRNYVSMIERGEADNISLKLASKIWSLEFADTVRNFRQITPRCCATCHNITWINGGNDLACDLENGPVFDGAEFDKWFTNVCDNWRQGTGAIGKRKQSE